MKKDILAKQKELESKEFKESKAVDRKALALYKKDPKLAQKYLTEYSSNNAADVLKQWWELADKLIVKYDDGYVEEKEGKRETVGYPKRWLKKVGYDKGPIDYKKNMD